jgi:Immune inhibitor A peptidase M6
MVALVVPATGSSATPTRRQPIAKRSEHRFTGGNYNKGRPLPLRTNDLVAPRGAASTPRLKVGKRKIFLAIDDVTGEIYAKLYKLRGKSEHIEVWVADDSDDVSNAIEFPAGDCRNDFDERIRITRAQVNYFMDEFENNMYPKESRAFSKPPRSYNGKGAILDDILELPGDYYEGPGRRIVTLVDNVRDDNFYDTDNSQSLPRIAGFFYSVFNEYMDRNIMSIDSYDWVHRTTGNPPNNPNPNDPCLNTPARPYEYEGTFAHEYQHLLEYYEDPDEVNWINEGLSDWAQTLTGYVQPGEPITSQDFDSHIQCFLGYLETQTNANPIPTDAGGAENSLNVWEDPQQEGEVLCDYGAAYTIMEQLHSRYGTDFMTAMHRDDVSGIPSLDNLLALVEPGLSGVDFIHQWAAMNALDGVLDDGALLTGGSRHDYRARTLHASINWGNDDSYGEPGAPPNGSDYVRARNDQGRYLDPVDIDSISFDGDATLPPDPVEWVVDPAAPDDGDGVDPAFFSGSGDNFDRSIVHEVSVPNADPTLTFDTLYDTEYFWDFAFVQVSTDGGQTWTSLANENTTSDHDPGAVPAVVAQLPGFTGESGVAEEDQGLDPDVATWVPQEFDLSAYAGDDILLGFRYITDPSVSEPGWWVDNVEVGGTQISDGESLTGWQTITQVFPQPIAGFTVQLVAYDDDHTQAWIGELPLDGDFEGELADEDLEAVIGNAGSGTVGIIVMYDEPTELVTKYAGYELRVNNDVQPGG